MYICDGAMLGGNLGVNPSLTITAMAERFAARFPARAITSAAVEEERDLTRFMPVVTV